MRRSKYTPTQAAPPPEGARASTFTRLLDTAMAIIRQEGHIPGVAEVAARAEVSRATAYRYFPSRSALITSVIDASLGPVRQLAPDSRGGRERVHALFKSTFPRFKEFEPQLRAAAQLALEHWGLEQAGMLREEPFRRGHRVGILEHAIAPLAPELPEPVRDRLHKALSVVYGIESFVILKDIWGLQAREMEDVTLWMADALIDAALRQGADAGGPAAAKADAAAARPAPAARRGPRPA